MRSSTLQLKLSLWAFRQIKVKHNCYHMNTLVPWLSPWNKQKQNIWLSDISLTKPFHKIYSQTAISLHDAPHWCPKQSCGSKDLKFNLIEICPSIQKNDARRDFMHHTEPEHMSRWDRCLPKTTTLNSPISVGFKKCPEPTLKPMWASWIFNR